MTDASARSLRTLTRADFSYLRRMPTRWSDNDMFGHLNNAVYYQLFDAAINAWTGESGGDSSEPERDPMRSQVIPVVAESSCQFYREVSYPMDLDVAVDVERLGRTSITYRLGLFTATDDPIAAAGRWVHVYIDRDTRQPSPIPTTVATLLATGNATGSAAGGGGHSHDLTPKQP